MHWFTYDQKKKDKERDEKKVRWNDIVINKEREDQFIEMETWKHVVLKNFTWVWHTWRIFEQGEDASTPRLASYWYDTKSEMVNELKKRYALYDL